MDKNRIQSVHARQVMDCKLRPMVEVDVITEDGVLGRGSAPTGTSVGMYEAFVLRDNDMSRFNGLSVYKAVDIVNTVIAPAIIGMDVFDQKAIDYRMIELDGTGNKSKLGGNSIYSVSIACARAAAASMKTELYKYMAKEPIKTLPVPTFNSINGGHSERLPMAIQEFTFSPYNAENMTEAIEIASEVFKQVGKTIAKYNCDGFAEMGHAYGWAPPSTDPAVVMSLLHEAVVTCGYEDKVAYALDCASSSQYDPKTGTYLYDNRRIDRDELIEKIKQLTETYNFLYIEDILEENDWEGFSKAARMLDRTIIIGDDLTVTNCSRLRKAYETNAVEGFIFKPNQIGTITEAMETCELAKQHGMLIVPSTRGGGAVDDIVMELAVAIQAGAVKNSAPRGGERIYSLNCLYRAADAYPNAKLFDLSEMVKFNR